MTDIDNLFDYVGPDDLPPGTKTIRSSMIHTSPEVQRLLDLLRRDFGLPENVTQVEIRLAVSDFVRITCQYLPVEKEPRP